jgi:hypothetical protein
MARGFISDSDNLWWADRVVLPALGFDQNPGFLQGVEDFSVKELIAQARIEAIDIAVLPRASWSDIGGLGTNRGDPRLHCLSDEPGAVV